MTRLHIIMFALVLAFPAIAQERVFLPKAEVEKIASGKKWIHVRTHDQRKILWDLREGGALHARGFVGTRTDNGQWSVNEKGQLCVKWHRGSQDRCVAVTKEGDKLLMVDSADLAGIYGELTVE